MPAATTALQRMSGVAEKFSAANDLMQNSAAMEQSENVQIKEKATPNDKRSKKPTVQQDKPKDQRMASRSKPLAQAVKQYNVNNKNIINSHFPAANDGQSVRMDKQIQLQQQQALSMKQLHSTMEEILHVLQRDANKITPKYQEFARGKGMTPEILGKAQNGMIDKIGSLMGDLMGSFRDSIGSLGDMMGGGKKKKRNKKRDRDRAKRRDESRARRGLPPMGEGGGGGGGWWSRAGEKLSGAMRSGASSVREGLSHGRGGGRVGTAMKIGAAVAGAVGVSKAVDWVGSKLGIVSKSEESGKGGVSTVSTGKGDKGGVSYGAHQLSSKTGSMTAYLQSPEGAKYANEFQGMRPGSAEFSQKYKEVAARDGQAFAESQEGYITRTHYAPQERAVSKATGTDMSKRGRAVQEMLYSTGVQYGPNSGVVSAALKGKAVANMSDNELIAAVQDYKAATVGRYFSSSSQDVQASIATRAAREKGKLLGIDQQEKEGKLVGSDPRKAAEMAKTQNASASEVATAQKAPVGTMPTTLAGNAAAFGGGNAEEEEEPVVAQAQPAPQGFPVSPTEAAGALLATGGVVAADKMVKPKPPISLLAPTPTAPTVAPVATPKLPAAANEPHLGAGTKGVVTGTEEALVKAGGRSAARTLGKAVVPGANVAFGALDAYDVISDEETTRQEKERALAGVGGGMAGAWAGGAAGTAAGAATGAAVGSLFFGVGAVPGAAIGTGLGFVGGAVGGYLGYDYGAQAGEAGYDALTGQPEDQAPRPVAGSTPLLMLTQKKADETGDQSAVDAAAAMKTVDDAIKKSTSAISVKLDANKEAGNKAAAQATEANTKAAQDAAATTSKAITAANTPAAVEPVPSSGAVSSSTPQNQGDMTSMLAAATTTGVAAGAGTVAGATSSLSAATADVGGALSGVAAGLAGMGLPPGWAESILANYSTAVATQDAAVAGAPAPVASQSTLPMPNTPSASPVYDMPAAQATPPTVDASYALPPDTAPVVLPGAPGSVNPFAPAKSAAPSVAHAAPTSPASPAYYKDDDVSPSASSLAATTPTTSSVNKSNVSPTTVSSAGAAPPQIERQQYEPVKSVMMIEPKQQDTMMPQRMQPAGDKIPSKGISEGNSVRQTIDDAPAVITDQGLIMLQTGFI